MAATRRIETPSHDADAGKKGRTDPDRLRAFAQRLNVMLGELGLPERGRARVIKEKVGVSGTTAANWLRGDSYPSFEELGRMTQLGVDPSRLLPEAIEASNPGASTTISQAAVSKRLTRLIDAGHVLPLSRLITEDGRWDHTALPNEIFTQLLGKNLEGFVLLRMKGDAMGDRIRDGTPLLVDTRVTEISGDNSVYALLVGESIVIRRVQHRLQGGFLITAENTSIQGETIPKLGSHLDEASRVADVVVLGKIELAIQKL